VHSGFSQNVTDDTQSEQAKELVQERRTNVQSLPQQARNRVQSLSVISAHKRVNPVRLPEWLYDETKLAIYVDPANREIRFSPGNGVEELHIIRTRIEVISDNAYAWAGDVYVSSGTHPYPIGDALFIQSIDGEINGNIDVEGLFFQVHPLGASGLHAIVEFDEEKMGRGNSNASPYHSGGAVSSETVHPTPGAKLPFKDVNTATQSETAYPTQPLEEQHLEDELVELQERLKAEEAFPSPCAMRYIRALVLYTESAKNYGNIENIINLAIQETNQAYSNSGVVNVSVVLEHSEEFNFNEGNDIENDLESLIVHPNAQDLREDHNADVVILLTGPEAYPIVDYGGDCEDEFIDCPPDSGPPNRNEFEWGIAGTLHLEEERAYAIVNVSKAAGPTYTFAHELGHIQGAWHHPDDIHSDDLTENPPLYDYGFGHRVSYSCYSFFTCKRATIMSWSLDSYTHIKAFSNPHINAPHGPALGIVNERENYKVLNNTREIVSDFRDANEPIAGISHTPGTTHQYGQNFTFNDNSCGGEGSISYQWRKSYGNPFNYGPAHTSSSWFVALSPGTWYIKLTVNTSEGQSSSKVISVQAQEHEDEGCQPGFPCGPIPKIVSPGTEQAPESFALLPAYPNPFNPASQIDFELPETRHVTLGVYDMTGRKVAVLADQSFTSGRHRVNFNAAGLSSGMYFVRMQAGEFVQTQTVTLVK